MKKVARWPFICSIALAFLSAYCSYLTAATLVDSAGAKALFKSPPREYSTGPLWVWNDLLTEQQIRDTLRDLAGQQVKQVWVHPRPGLMTPYLSNDWFRLWKIALDEATRLDMNVWIYDENSYPSGFAGGFVPQLMPESRGRGLSFAESNTVSSCAENVLGIYRLTENGYENLLSRVKAGETLPEASYLIACENRAGNDPWHGNRCYVNLLSPGVTEKFLDITMGAYRKEIGDQFGKRVPGVFCDEPNIRPAGGLPWSEILVAEFQKRWGYNLLDHLPSLTRPLGDWRKIRHNYYQVLNEQFIEHWSKPYHNFCADNHLEWTGHYWDHEWPDCVGVPDNMAMYAWHQRPGIDCLMNQYSESTHAQFGNVRMAKELSSVANQLGMPRTLCEVYGAGGWDLRFEDMKRIGDWLEVLGVNTLDQHLSYVTIRGARKRDHPQSFSYHEPWWEAYHVSAEYLARLSAAMSQGQQMNRVLVLEPTTTAWMYQGNFAKLRELGDSFFKLVMALEAAQVEYDICSEDVLSRHGALEGASTTQTRASGALSPVGGVRIGNRSYHQLVFPPLTENINSRTAQILNEFLELPDTEVLALGEAPTRVDGAESDTGAAFTRRPRWKKFEPGQIHELAPEIKNDGFALNRESRDKGILFHHRRQLADGELLLLVNTSIEAPAKGIFESRLQGVERWNLYTGEVEKYPFQKSADGVKAQFELPASGSLLLFLSSKPLEPAASKMENIAIIKPTAPPQIHRSQPNVLTLDYVDIAAGQEMKNQFYFYKANQFVWQQNGLQRNPWDSAVQFEDELISKRFPAESGFTVMYRFTIDGPVPNNLAIVLERADAYSITCNGKPVAPKPNEWWLDKAFGRIELSGSARSGQNLVAVRCQPFTMFGEVEPAYVLGDFSLEPTEHGFVITADRPLELDAKPSGQTGARGWNQQGHPFYGSGVSYEERFQVASKEGQYLVNLPKWYGSVAKVTVNGKPAGYIDAPPSDCDVTKWIQRGENTVTVEVIGTLKNTLGPHHVNALGAAWPSAFQKGPETGPPPGTNYSTVAYGLFEPFLLKQITAAPRNAAAGVQVGQRSER